MKNTMIAVVVILMGFGFVSSDAFAKGCPDGFSAANKGVCYRIDGVSVDYGVTTVRGVVISSKNYGAVFLSVALYQGNKVAGKAVSVLNDVEKNDEIAFEAMCSEEVSNPTKTKLRIDVAM